MAKFRSIKNSFIAGQISPTSFGRTDLPQYPHACKLFKNQIPLLSGGSTRRPGTRFAFASENPVALYPFVFSKTESYAVGVFSTGPEVVGIVRKDPDYAASLDHTPTIIPATTLIIGTPFEPTNDDFYLSIFDLQYVQSADIMYFVHSDMKPARIVRTAINAFTIKNFDQGLTGSALRDAYPYLDQNTTATTLTPSATTGSGVTLTASAALFSTDHIGSIFKINHAGTYGAIQITGYSSSTVVTGTVIVNFGSTGASAAWWEAAWSVHQGWPRTIAFFKSRLVYGGTKESPDSIWFSEDSDYDQLSVDALIKTTTPGDGSTTGPAGIDPFTIIPSEQQLNSIQWMSSERGLLVGTLADEILIDRETTGGFGSDNAQVEVVSHYGSAYKKAIRAGSELFFVRPSQLDLRAFVFNNQEQSFTGDPLQVLFDEYPKIESLGGTYEHQMRSLAWDNTRNVLWGCDSAGNMFGMTRERRLGIIAWHVHELGGFDGTIRRTGDDISPTVPDPSYFLPTGSVVSLCVVPDPVRNIDDVWICSLRKIDGDWIYHVEFLSGLGRSSDSIYDHYYTSDATYYVDDLADYNNLLHLEGETVTALYKGTHGLTEQQGKIVLGGAISISAPTGNEITLAGYKFSSTIIPVRIEAGSQIGSAQGAIKRIHEAFVRFYKTITCKIGRDADNLETLVFRTSDTLQGQSAEFFTGDKRVKIDCDYDRDGFIYLVADNALPMNVISISLEGLTYDG